MKTKVYGFKFKNDIVPRAMNITDLYGFMSANAGAKLGKLYQYGATKVTFEGKDGPMEWWAGMILKVRDSKAFTKLTESDGKTTLTAEILAENEKLVELTYFIAHPETGSGLLAHHYHGTSITSFAVICRKLFAAEARLQKEAAVSGKTKKEAKEIAQDYKGTLSLIQLCNDTDLKDLVKGLKRVSSFELRLATLETKETFLRGIVEKASNEIIKLTFPPDSDIEELADSAVELSNAQEVAEVIVSGYDSNKNRRQFFKDKNPLVFNEFDYDESIKDLVLDLDDWPKSIGGSEVVSKLAAMASGESVLNLLLHA
ncbi:hypothetical protein [Pelagicoccus sp. SDUM812003]|uniref:hypothetical protein n=1 Tax=Pelagicoccus sp. SDUM812003 TaxID=3041267 RepID=UPI00280E8A9B|nr:hypothetical protein [Pelagicoccus sp. SDUM812003]MDQ8201493.1 hypothetical protein [Pelagicoccus sp. SDUM812003]